MTIFTQSNLAPIAIFIFARPDHLRKTLQSLLLCQGFDCSPIIVFGDGPKVEAQKGQVEAARRIAREVLGDRATYYFSDTNHGLAKSVMLGVTKLVNQYGRAIVVEDDLELAPNFLNFMNEALDRYSDDERVYQISGHAFEVPEFAQRSTAIFLPITTTWGWGTWKRAWDFFDPASTGWEKLSVERQLRTEFNFGNVYDYASMLQRQMRGRSDSWGVRWYWSVFSQNGMTCFPPQTLVRNTGMDGTGTHGRGFVRRYKKRENPLLNRLIGFSDAKLNDDDLKAVQRAIRRQNGGSVGKLIDVAKKIFS